MIAILVNIRSAHNVGSMFRTADAAGVEKLYLCGVTPAPIDHYGRVQKDILKVSLGAEKTVAWEKVGTSSDIRPVLRLLNKLKQEGFKLYALEQDNHSMPYMDIRPAKKELARTALIVGNEVAGLPRSILSRADKILEIPMHGQKESLNVAVAFGILAFSLTQS